MTLQAVKEMQSKYDWLCSECMLQLIGIEPDMDWPGFKAGTCERCRQTKVVFVTKGD